jgi:hypothetical protein
MSSNASPHTAYFSGGNLPPGFYFSLRLQDLWLIIDNTSTHVIVNVSDLAYIGMVGYAECFFKDHFAAAINIVPELVKNLPDTKIDAALLVDSWRAPGNPLQNQLGFYLAEKRDFGSAKEVNARYCALLQVSPFTTEGRRTYDRILENRNLLVHHGGVYTTSVAQIFNRILDRSVAAAVTDETLRRPFKDTLKIDPQTFRDDASFLREVAGKLVENSYQAIKSYVQENQIELSGVQAEALEAFHQWVDFSTFGVPPGDRSPV